MISYADKTFCFSPDCKNECGRQLTYKDRIKANELDLPICGAYFCGTSEDKENKWTICDDNKMD